MADFIKQVRTKQIKKCLTRRIWHVNKSFIGKAKRRKGKAPPVSAASASYCHKKCVVYTVWKLIVSICFIRKEMGTECARGVILRAIIGQHIIAVSI